MNLTDDLAKAAQGSDETWVSVAGALGAALGGRASAFSVVDLKSRHLRVTWASGLEAGRWCEYEAEAPRSPWVRDLLRNGRTGEAKLVSAVLPIEALRRTRIHARWLRPLGLLYSLGVTISSGPRWVSEFRTFRAEEDGDFPASALALARETAPHVLGAIRAQMSARAMDTMEQAIAAALRGSRLAACVLDDSGRVRTDTRGTFDGLGGVFDVEDGRLRGPSRSETEAIDAAVTTATALGQEAELRLSRPELLTDYAVSVLPIATDVRSCLVLVREAEREDAPEAATWAERCRALGFTAAETRLALGLAGGRSVKEIAEDHGVSRNTIRTQLKTVFLKAGVSRQADLVRLLIRGSLV